MPLACFFNKSSDYRRLLRSRRRVTAGVWELRAAVNAQSSTPRFSVVIAKRYIRGAAQRNAIRRRLREHFRQELQYTLPPMDYLMRVCKVWRRSVDEARLREDCRHLFLSVKR